MLRDLASRQTSGTGEIFFALYDALIDDDDEVRDVAAHVLTFAIHPPDSSGGPPAIKSHLMPATALDGLLSYLERGSFQQPWVMTLACVSRITGASPPKSKPLFSQTSAATGSMSAPVMLSYLLPSTRRKLASALVRDTTLFVEEKQNLHVDPVQEADRWARVLFARIGHSPHPELAGALRGWVLEGLTALTEIAEAQMGGPLSWTSNLEVFLLGMRVLIVASVVTSWKGMYADFDRDRKIMDKLRRLQELGPEKRLHRSWRLRVDALLR